MKFYILLLSLVTLIACNTKQAKFNIDDAYKAQFEENLLARAENRINYLQLTGLFKLDSTSTFGKDTINNFVLDIKDLPPTIGTILLQDTVKIFSSHKGVLVKNSSDSTVTNVNLKFDEYGSSQKLFYKRLNWQIITRSKQYYLRVWDTKNPAIKNFKGFELFELNPEFIFDAQFVYYKKLKTEIVKAEVDGQRSTSFIGKVTFKYNDETYDLEVGESGFTMVSDKTTGEETYGGGRYIYLHLPKTDGSVTLDFNKLYNPPCAFSEFTTCLYPPRQNNLPFKVLAGEKIYFSNTYQTNN